MFGRRESIKVIVFYHGSSRKIFYLNVLTKSASSYVRQIRISQYQSPEEQPMIPVNNKHLG